MKKLFSILLALTLLLGTTSAFADLEDFDIVTNAEDNKIIYDTDMGYMSDDSIALFALLKADEAGWIDLLGVTSVGGNVFAAPATTAILNQLERLDRGDIPVYEGKDVPIAGFRDLEKEKEVYGGFTYTGAYRKMADYTTDYMNLGGLENEEWGYPETLRAQEDMDAVDFIIESVHKYPGKVTIFAVGACTNVALAIRKDPTVVEDAAGIVYMGGAIDVPGNASVTAEFNWWYDIEAAAMCVSAPWHYQLIVPHDVAPKVLMAKDVVDMYVEKNNTLITELLVEKLGPQYEETPTKTGYCWDPITVGVFLCPDLITESEVRATVVDTTRGYSYGNVATWAVDNGPYNAKPCTIVFDVDRDAFWTLMSDMFGTNF